jgi:enterobacterial common antigen flippase
MLERILRILPPRALAGSAASQAFRLLVLVWVGRRISTDLGAEGILALGVLQNILALGLALPSQALQMPIQQTVAAAGADARSRGAEALLLGQILAIIASAAMAVLILSGRIYLPDSLRGVGWILPVGICFSAAAADLQAVAVGQGRLGRVNVLTSILTPLQALWLLAWISTGRPGMVPGVLLFGLLAFPATVAWVGLPRLDALVERLRNLKSWMPLLAMGGLMTVIGPSAQMLLRQFVLKGGLHDGATWQAAIRLSDILFGTWTLAFTTWALPRIAAKTKDLRIGFLSVAGAGIMALGALLFAPLLLSLAYADRFADAAPVLRLQALAEVARAFGLTWTLRLMAKRAVVAFSILEASATALQLGLAWWLIPRLGPLGAPAAVLVESTFTGILTRRLVLREDEHERRRID